MDLTDEHTYQGIGPRTILPTYTEDLSIVEFIDGLLDNAIKQGVSDIHFEPYDHFYRIRYRQDGILHEITQPPTSLSARITARLKVLSNLDISEKRVPQDGSFRTQAIDVRVSTCPTSAGEKVVLRILDSEFTQLSIEDLGFNPSQKSQLFAALQRSQGMILVTGPTGSGKTMTLYTALNKLNRPEVNISTIEDPVELKMAGINQVAVNTKAGLTFSNLLRALLRQDPDIIMVGEIRDNETAELAIKAAQTGHLVLSTLHSNSAAETLNRLLHLSISSLNIATSISLIIAQRLARKLCEHCKIINNDYSTKTLNHLGINASVPLFQAIGCSHCHQGYQGRIGLFELLPMTKQLSQLILSGGNSLQFHEEAIRQGMLSLYQQGLNKVAAGLTTLEEINRVTIE